MAEAQIDREAALREIAEARVEARWFRDDIGPGVNLSLPYDCKFGGDWYIRDDDRRVVTLDV